MKLTAVKKKAINKAHLEILHLKPYFKTFIPTLYCQCKAEFHCY